MADLPDTWRNEFADLGEEEVRKCLGMRYWSEDKERLARQWLQSGELAKVAEDRRATLALAKDANDLARKANDAAKEANDVARTANEIANRNVIIATLALIVAVIAIAISIFGLFLTRG